MVIIVLMNPRPTKPLRGYIVQLLHFVNHKSMANTNPAILYVNLSLKRHPNKNKSYLKR